MKTPAAKTVAGESSKQYADVILPTVQNVGYFRMAFLHYAIKDQLIGYQQIAEVGFHIEAAAQRCTHIRSFEPVVPMIYAYSHPDNNPHQGRTKLGYTEKQSVEDRVR
jgi:hypothetical protein